MNLARVAWDENNLALNHELLEKSRPRAGEPDLRGFEWYYLDRLARGGQLRIDAHAGGVNSVAFMPDGKRLISAGIAEPLRRLRASKGAAGAVSLWDAATGRPIPLELDGSADKVAAVALSPDGKRLAASRRDHAVLLWDLATGRPVALEGPAKHVAFGVRFSPESKRLVSLYRSGELRPVGEPVSMRVWDLASCKPVVTVDRVRAGHMSEATFSPDGKQLVVCPSSPGSFSVYDAETGRETFSREVRDEMLHCAGFSPDSTGWPRMGTKASAFGTWPGGSPWSSGRPNFTATAWCSAGTVSIWREQAMARSRRSWTPRRVDRSRP